MEDKFINYDEFCNKFGSCEDCPLGSVDNCEDVYEEAKKQDGVVIINIKKEMER